MRLALGVLLDALFVILLAWCSVSDIRKRAVPNGLIILLLCLSLAHTALLLPRGHSWWQYPTGLILSIPFLIAWLKNSMGAADVKLIMVIGLYLGLLNTLVSFALIIPVLAVIITYTWFKHKTLKHRIPMAPVLAFGAAGTVAIEYLYILIRS